MVKDAWRSKYRISEGALLDMAKERGAWGAVDCRFHGDVQVEGELDVISSNIRQGFDYADAKRVPMPVKIIDGMLCLSTSEVNYHDDRLSGQRSVACSSNAEKRQLPGQSKRARLADARSEECESSDEEEDIDCADIDGGQEDEDIDCADIDGERVHIRLVCYTVGRNIDEFSSVRELLEAFRDANVLDKYIAREP